MNEKETNIAIGCDHAGYIMKEYIKKTLINEGYQVKDYGCFSEERVDYPDFAHAVANAIANGSSDKGILICGSGNGVCMTANKHKEIRAALCWNNEIALLSRLHNDANIVCIPARFINEQLASEIIRIFLITEFEGSRHEQRVKKIPYY
jgi:ribose 5-phosphate isomerase B